MIKRTRIPAVAVALFAAASLVGCGTAAPAPLSSPAEADGWRKVSGAGTVHGIFGVNSFDPPPHLLAAGVRLGGPLLIDVTDGRRHTVDADLTGHGDNGLVRVASDGDAVAVVESDGAGPARLWLDAATPEDLRDEQGRRPAELWPLLDGEGDVRAVGAVRAGDRWELRVWESRSGWRLVDRGARLSAPGGAEPGGLLAASTEGAVVVAGALTDPSGRSAPTPGVWSIDALPEETSDRWQQHPLNPAPDAITDLVDWPVGWWVAGRRGFRPVLYDFNDADGAALPAPDTRLAADHPVVYLAANPLDDALIVATQSVDGPQVWVHRPNGTWLRIPGPAGRLTAARAVGAGIYLLVDGNLWFRRL